MDLGGVQNPQYASMLGSQYGDGGFGMNFVPTELPAQNPDAKYKTLKTDEVIKYDKLDQGFILRANPEVTELLRRMIKDGTEGVIKEMKE